MPKYPFLSGSLLIIPPPEFDTMTSYYSTREPHDRFRIPGIVTNPGQLNPAGLSAPYEGGYVLCLFDTIVPILYTPGEAEKDTFSACGAGIHVFSGGTMCDLNAYIYQEGKEELYLESVNSAKSEEGKVYLTNLFGEHKVFEGTIQEVSLSGHRIILAER